MATPTSVGIRLTHVRQMVEGLSRRELSLLAKNFYGVGSHSVVTQIEAGDIQNPSSRLLVALSTILGGCLDWLASGTGEPPAGDVVRASVATYRERARQSGAPVSATGTDGEAPR